MAIRKEHRLLLICAQTHPSEDDRVAIRSLASDPGLDWDYFYGLSIRHKLMPLVYSNLKSWGAASAKAEETFRNRYLINLTRNALLSDELTDILGAFEKYGIPVMPFKGPALAEMVYGDIGLRMFTDLDILVHVHDAVRARDILVESGYTADIGLTGTRILTYVENENFFRLARKETSVTVDLHWEMTGLYSLKPVFLQDLLEKGVTGRFQGHNIILSDMTMLFMYLCIHSSSHYWDNLESVACLASMLKGKVGRDLKRLIRAAEKYKVRRMVLTGLWLCEKLFRINLPADIRQLIENDGVVKRLGGRIVERLFADPGDRPGKLMPWRYSLVHFMIRDTVPDGIHYAMRLLFRPTVKEWMYFPLPRRLSWIHSILRPLRLIGELMIGGKEGR